MASPTSTVRNAGLIAAMAPVLGAIVIRWALGGAPVDVAAGQNQMLALPQIPAQTQRLNDQQMKAKEFSLQAIEKPFGSSPMSRSLPKPVVIEDTHETDRPVEQTPVDASLPVFNVTSILVSARHQLATINGHLYRTGDEITPGWRLKTIDSVRGVVVLVSNAGRSIEAPVRRSSR